MGKGRGGSVLVSGSGTRGAEHDMTVEEGEEMGDVGFGGNKCVAKVPSAIGQNVGDEIRIAKRLADVSNDGGGSGRHVGE